MLNKKVCKRCRCDEGFWWNQYDDDRWDNSEVICITRGSNKSVELTTESIPELCKFKLEHVVSKDKEGDNNED